MLTLALKVTDLAAQAIFIIGGVIPAVNLEQLKEIAAKNAKNIGVDGQEWGSRRGLSERVADLFMAFDPEGERLLIANDDLKQSKKLKDTEDIKQ